MGVKLWLANGLLCLGAVILSTVPVLMYLAIWLPSPDGRLAATGLINILLGFFLAFWGGVWKDTLE